MKIIKISFLIVIIFVGLIGFKYYQMSIIHKLDPEKIDKPPQFLAKHKMVYFDNFSDSELIKYRDFLKLQNIDKIGNLNEKVIAMTNLINIAHSIQSTSPEKDCPEFIIIKGNKSYCQRSSILLSKMLSSLGVYSRHWHASYQNGMGFHQFIEYYNPDLSKWIIIDPYYGIQYAKVNELLSVTEVGSTLLKGNKIENLVKKLAIAKFSYSIEEIRRIWQQKMVLGRIADYTKQHKGAIRYGFLANIKSFNRLPEKVKKIFRIVGRDNSMYEIFNFKG